MLRQLVFRFSREIALCEIISEVPQVSLVEVGASDRRERGLETDGALWVPNSPFGNSAVRLARRRACHQFPVYLADGWQIYAACRDPASASQLRRLAEDCDEKLRILALDVTDPADIHAAATERDGQAIVTRLFMNGLMGELIFKRREPISLDRGPED